MSAPRQISHTSAFVEEYPTGNQCPWLSSYHIGVSVHHTSTKPLKLMISFSYPLQLFSACLPSFVGSIYRLPPIDFVESAFCMLLRDYGNSSSGDEQKADDVSGDCRLPSQATS
jgi:hypothetical protein